MKDKVLSSLKWVTLSKLLTQLIRWSATIFTMRILNPEDYALIALCSFFLEFLWAFSANGISASLIRTQKLNDRLLEQFYSFAILAHVLLIGILQLAAPVIASFYETPDLELVIRVATLTFLFSLIGVIHQALLTREMRFKAIAIIAGVSESVVAILIFVFAYLGFGYWSIILGNIVMVIMKQIGFVLALPKLIVPSKMTRDILEMVKFSAKSALNGVLTRVKDIDIAIAGVMLSVYQLGVYHFAVMLAMMPASKTLPLLRQVAFPVYSKIQNDRDQVNKYLLKSQRMGNFLFVPIFLGMAACSFVLIPLLFGEKWQDAMSVLALYCLVMPIRSTHQLFGPVMKSLNKVGVLIRNTFIYALILIPCFFYFGKQGPEGFAIAWVVGFIAYYIVTVAINCSVLKLSWKGVMSTLIAPYIAGGVMFASVFYLGDYLMAQQFALYQAFIIQIPVGAVAYLGMIWVINRSLIIEFISIFKKKSK